MRKLSKNELKILNKLIDWYNNDGEKLSFTHYKIN